MSLLQDLHYNKLRIAEKFGKSEKEIDTLIDKSGLDLGKIIYNEKTYRQFEKFVKGQ